MNQVSIFKKEKYFPFKSCAVCFLVSSYKVPSFIFDDMILIGRDWTRARFWPLSRE